MKKAQTSATQKNSAKKAQALRNLQGAKKPAVKAATKTKVQKSIPATVAAAVTGTTGLAVIGSAIVGVAGFFAWKNREQILNFVGKYVDLPESLVSDKATTEESVSWDTKGSLNTVTPDSYTKPTTEHRM